VGRPAGPNGSFRYHFPPFRFAFGTILDHFATWVAQTVQKVAFDAILNNFATCDTQ